MAILEFGDGLANHSGYKRAELPIFFDDEYNVLPAPTQWIMDVAKRRSRSRETVRNYAFILLRFLNWLDHSEGQPPLPVGCRNWQVVDNDLFDMYLLHISEESGIIQRIPSHDTVLHYAYRLWDFYCWADRAGYEHLLKLDSKEVRHRTNDQMMLAHSAIKRTQVKLNVPTGRPALHQREMDKFVTQSNYELALSVFDDAVFQVIAAVIRITALRPKDLFQLPYRGKGDNSGFVPYDSDEIPEELSRTSIHYEFESKGKRRSIEFPGKLWRTICLAYIPLRRERARLYEDRYGIPPRNDQLFLTSRGEVVNYHILRYHFKAVVEKVAALPSSDTSAILRRFTPGMLRHTCATYFVYEALKQQGRLGRHFVYDASLDEELRKLLGHSDVRTTLEYYVHLVNRFTHDNLLQDLKRAQVDQGLSAILELHGYDSESPTASYKLVACRTVTSTA